MHSTDCEDILCIINELLILFNNNVIDRKIYVPASDDDTIINAYKAADGWSNYAADIEEYDFND